MQEWLKVVLQYTVVGMGWALAFEHKHTASACPENGCTTLQYTPLPHCISYHIISYTSFIKLICICIATPWTSPPLRLQKMRRLW